MAYFKIFDASGNLIMDDESTVFRVIGRQFIAGDYSGDPNINGGSGTITDAGLATGTPYCWAMFNGTVNNGATGSSADPPAPNISFSGSDLNYSNLWGDWSLIYGVA